MNAAATAFTTSTIRYTMPKGIPKRGRRYRDYRKLNSGAFPEKMNVEPTWYGSNEVAPLYLHAMPVPLKRLMQDRAEREEVSLAEFAARCMKLGFERFEGVTLDKQYRIIEDVVIDGRKV